MTNLILDEHGKPITTETSPEASEAPAPGAIVPKASAEPPKPYIAPKLPIDADNSPAGLLAVAVRRGANVDELDKLLALKERYDAEEARRAYTAAMAIFKSNAPEIFKDKQVSYDNVSYSHATLGNVANVIASALGEYGLSHAWSIVEQDKSWIKVRCTVTHEAGHSESAELGAGADDSGKKNPIQAIASTVTYLERYTLLAITGMAAQEGDDDGVRGGGSFIDEEQEANLRALMDEIPSFNMTHFLKAMGKLEDLAAMPAARYKQAVKVLEAKRANS
jgi:hypothetical protein